MSAFQLGEIVGALVIAAGLYSGWRLVVWPFLRLIGGILAILDTHAEKAADDRFRAEWARLIDEALDSTEPPVVYASFEDELKRKPKRTEKPKRGEKAKRGGLTNETYTGRK